MKNMKIFDTPQDIKEYILENRIKKIGCGVQGETYLAKDNTVLKEMHAGFVVPYDDTIIISDKFKLDSFIFPDELYIANDLVYGYKAKFFKNDVFCDMYRTEDKEIDLEKLLKARLKVIEDIKVLTEYRYGLDDTIGNVLFDGEKLALIDTLGYVKDDTNLDDNLRKLDLALDIALYKINPLTGEWNMPFINKVKLLERINRSNKVMVKPMIK